MTAEQVSADRLIPVELTLDQNARALEFWCDCQTFPKMAARQIVYLADQLTDLRASLRREENSRKVLADENDRLRAQANELRDELHDLERKVTALEHAG